MSFFNGTAYAFSSKGIKYYDPSVLTSIRMFIALSTSLIVLITDYLRIKRDHITFHNFTEFNNPAYMPYALLCGVISFGFPHALISMSQKYVNSSIVVVMQPFVSLIQFILSGLFLTGEPFTLNKFIANIIAIAGSLIASIPTLTGAGANNNVYIGFTLLITALFSFAVGGVIMKKYCSNTSPIKFAFYKLLGASVSSFIFSVCVVGSIEKYFEIIHDAGIRSLVYPVLLGICFTYTSTYLGIYCTSTLGSIITAYSNYIQILFGVFVGVVFLGEWEDYTAKNKFVSCCGILLIMVSMVLGLRKTGDIPREEIRDDNKCLLSNNDQI